MNRCVHCGSKDIEVRRRFFSNRTEHLQRQCNHCGGLFGDYLKKSTVSGPVKDVDKEAQQRFLRWRKTNRAIVDHACPDAEWWDRYERHLASLLWQKKRRAVLDRDGHECQACLSRPATDVHHRTYKRMGNEPLFDLISVCRTCHQKLHPDRNLECLA